MATSDYKAHFKQSQKYKLIVDRRQEKFNLANENYVRYILTGVDSTSMSQDIIDSIEENALMYHYYQLRMLAEEQKDYFKNRG